jgi:hypothetical protein
MGNPIDGLIEYLPKAGVASEDGLDHLRAFGSDGACGSGQGLAPRATIGLGSRQRRICMVRRTA